MKLRVFANISKWFSSFRHEKRTSSGRPDVSLVFLILGFCLFGILMVYDSSVALAIRDFGNQYYFVRDQLKWVFVGWIAFFITSNVHYKMWYQIALPILMGTIVLLLIVFVPGVGISALGAKRWINMGFFVLQPAELAKLALVVYLSAWFSYKERKRFWQFLFLMVIVVGLIVKEPDLGTSIVVIGIGIAIYFFSGSPIKYFVVFIPILIAGIILLSILSPYRYRRLTSFLDPSLDPLDSSYQIRQVTLALGSGGMFGVGLGKSRQKYQYLPEANTDSIFAIIGEETGLVGGTMVLFAYLYLIFQGFSIAVRSPDVFGKFLAGGITTWIALQAGINIAANVALIPLTGVPLPLISYGGSSTIIVLTALGILNNIKRQISYV